MTEGWSRQGFRASCFGLQYTRVSVWRGSGTREKPNRPFPGRLNPGRMESSAYPEDTKGFEEPQSTQRQRARDVLLVFRKKKKNVPCWAICSRFLGKSLHVELYWVSRNKMQRHLQQRTIVDWATVRFGSLGGSRLSGLLRLF